MKTSELIGPALDWAVAKCDNEDWTDEDCLVNVTTFDEYTGTLCNYSTDWAQGGPIIEREGISVAYDAELAQPESREYWATIYAVDSGDGRIYGPTPLIAAMRCYVALKLGDEVETPYRSKE